MYRDMWMHKYVWDAERIYIKMSPVLLLDGGEKT